MMTRHSMSKGCPRSPHRDATEQSKAKLSPWTLGGTASAQADRPRTARCKATREGRAKALSAGQRDESASCQAAGAVVTLAPSQRADTSCPLNKQRGARLKVLLPRAYYPDRRVVTSAGLALRRVWRVRGVNWPRQKGKSPNHPLAESPDSTKASGATVGYHN